MIRVRVPYSVFNGYETADNPGDIIGVSPQQARKILVDGGALVDKDGNDLPLEEQVRMSRLELSDLPPEGERDERQEALAQLISS